MTAPSTVRSTVGFRSIVLFELDSSSYPIGAVTLEAQTPYKLTGAGGSTISGSTVSISAGATVSGSVGYYGIKWSGAKVLTINDPTPRVMAHVGDDGVICLQVLPALEPANGELRLDKTNDIVDAIAANINKFTVGQANMLGSITGQRGFENQVGALAYSFAQDTDPDSSQFGSSVWDFRLFPKATVFVRDTGYSQEVNERMYSFTPAYCVQHIWGTTFSIETEGFTRAQIVRGVSQYKPVLVSYKGDGSTLALPFDSAKPAASAEKIAVWVNGALKTVTTDYTASVSGVVMKTAPADGAIVCVFYETA